MAHRPVLALLLIPLALVAATSLTGCSQVADAVHRTHEESFPDRAAALKGWVGVAAPDWLPGDATNIRNLATDDESNAVIAVTTSSPLPAGCTETNRHAIPFDSPGWAPKFESFPDRVERCGDYEVLRTDTGWFGWFTATAAGRTPGATTAPVRTLGLG